MATRTTNRGRNGGKLGKLAKLTPRKRNAPKRREETPRRKRTEKRKVARVALPSQRHFSFGTEGRFFDLQEIFDRLNARYFRNSLRKYTITWGRRRKLRPLQYFVFGTIQEEDRVIRVHPLLDQSWVPKWFVDFVVYHEMLHAVVPDKYDESGNRVIHHAEFQRREKKFWFFRRAQEWEAKHLERFLR